MSNLTTTNERIGYYAVKWDSALRITSDRVGSSSDACRNCYGMVANNMSVKFLSSRKEDVRKVGFKKEKLETAEGWGLVPLDQLPGVERYGRCKRCGGLLDSDTGGCKDQTCPFNDHLQKCPKGWTGHPQHPGVDENTPCNCPRA